MSRVKLLCLIITLMLLFCGCSNELETVQFDKISQGFLVNTQEAKAVSISGGKLQSVTLQDSKNLVGEIDNTFFLDFKWGTVDDLLYGVSSLDSWTVEAVPGSSNYLMIDDAQQAQGPRPLLYNTKKGYAINYLATLEDEVRNNLSSVTFSPDGNHMLMGLYKDTGCLLRQPDPIDDKYTWLVDPGTAYSVGGHFLDNNTILLVIGQEHGGAISYTLRKYTISDGTSQTLDYSLKDDGLTLYGGVLATQNNDGAVTVVDLLASSEAKTIFSTNSVERIFYVSHRELGVISAGTVYLLDSSGKAQPVCKTP